MPPRHVYWTIIVDGQPTAFRAAEREELLPTLNRLKEKHPSAVLQWFERGHLWASREEAQARRREGYEVWSGGKLVPPRGARTPTDSEPREARGKNWRPGGTHRDPREKYQLAKKAKWARLKREWRRGGPPDASTSGLRPAPRQSNGDRGPQATRQPSAPGWKPKPRGADDRRQARTAWKPGPRTGTPAAGPHATRQPSAPGWKPKPRGADDRYQAKTAWKPGPRTGKPARPHAARQPSAPGWKPKPRSANDARQARSDWKPAPRTGKAGTGAQGFRTPGGPPRSPARPAWKPRPEGASGRTSPPRPDDRSRGPGGWKPKAGAGGRPKQAWQSKPKPRTGGGGWKKPPTGGKGPRGPKRGKR